MELIKLNDKLSILINQDNCSAAEARITSQTVSNVRDVLTNRAHLKDLPLLC